MVQKNWFALPPVMEYYYASLHPEYKPLPPFAPDCLQEGKKLMAFIYPKKNEAVLLPKNFDENVNEVIFKLADRSPETTVFWYLDSEYIGKTETFHELAVSPKPGKYLLTATDEEVNQVSETIEIMPGGRINLKNASKFKEAGFKSVHLSATTKKQVLAQKPKVSMQSEAFFEEGIVATSNKETIKNIIQLLNS